MLTYNAINNILIEFNLDNEIKPNDIDQQLILELQNYQMSPERKAKVDELLNLVIKYQELLIKSHKLKMGFEPLQESSVQKYRTFRENLIQKDRILKNTEMYSQLQEQDPKFLQELEEQYFENKKYI